MIRRRVRVAAFALLAALLGGCSGGGGSAAPGTSAAGDGSTTTAATAPTTSAGAAGTSSTTTTAPPLLARLAGRWIGGDPVEWARSTCVSTSGKDACADLPTQLSWQAELARCLGANGLDVGFDDVRLVATTGRGDPARTSAAWERCRAGYVRSQRLAVSTVDANLWTADCVADKGWILALRDPSNTETGADISACDRSVTMRACLRDNGANLGDPFVLRVHPRYAPEVAQTVWAACRDLWLRLSYGAWQGEAAAQLPDCMAARGWLVGDYVYGILGQPSDVYLADAKVCTPPTAYDRYTSCLRENGIDAPPNGTNTTDLPLLAVRPVELTRGAWRACRDLWMQSQDGPDQVPATVLVRTNDCLADLGWISVLSRGVEDPAAYQRATATCNGPQYGGSVARTGALPSFPTRDDWISCVRGAGVDSAADRLVALRTRQVFASTPVTDAYIACATRWTGMPAGMFQSCAANSGIVPGLGGLGTWDVVESCGIARWSFTGREVTAARRPFERCLVEHGSTSEPILHTFDVVLGAWEECVAGDPRAAGDVTIALFDRTEADLPTLHYWACLADHGLWVPDPRRSEPAPTLAVARAAIAACRDLAVVVRVAPPSYGD